MRHETDNVQIRHELSTLRDFVDFFINKFTLGIAMASTRKYNIDLVRNVAWTECADGPLGLRPITTPHSAGYLDASIDFEAQSYHRTPKHGEAVSYWTTGYVRLDGGDKTTICADLIALSMAGVSAGHAHRWLIAYDLAGLVWPTIADALTRPTCCIVLLLNRTVTEHTYKLLSLKLARDVFADLPDPAQADFRHRFDYPRMPSNESQLLRHNGNALPVDYAISLDSISGDAIGTYAAAHAEYI
jgi:hypothetical protein